MIKTDTEISDDRFYYSQDVMMNHKKVEESMSNFNSKFIQQMINQTD